MSWYRVYEIYVLRVGQLFLQQNIDSIYPSAGMGTGSNNNPYYASSPDGINWTPRQTFTTSVFGIGYPLQREKTFSITNTNWTGRSTQQNFRIVSV